MRELDVNEIKQVNGGISILSKDAKQNLGVMKKIIATLVASISNPSIEF